MKKYIFKTCLMAIVACFCLSIASCSKSPEQISKEAHELINDEGAIDPENIDKAIDLYEATVNQVAELTEKLNKAKESGEEISPDNPLITDGIVLATAGASLRDALSNSQFSDEQAKRLDEIESKLQ